MKTKSEAKQSKAKSEAKPKSKTRLDQSRQRWGRHKPADPVAQQSDKGRKKKRKKRKDHKIKNQRKDT